MENTQSTHLSLLILSGQDAKKFLQNQCTANVEDCSAERAVFTCICNTKGRMIASFLLVKMDETRFGLVLENTAVEPLQSHLSKYLVFSNATLEAQPEASIQLGQGFDDTPFKAQSHDETIRVQHPNQDYCWEISLNNPNPSRTYNIDADISQRIYFTSREDAEQLLPQLINLDAFNGISYSKGCYIGQEIIARMKYLGKQKKQLELFSFDGPSPNKGDSVHSDDKKAGEVLAVGRSQCLLAVVNIDAKGSMSSNKAQLTKIS